MSYKLDNYLRTYRKRTGLSQDEMAFLLGTRSGSKVSRYERCARKPTLETAFAYEVITRASQRDLFTGLYQRTERATLTRIRALRRRLLKAKPDRTTSHKLRALGGEDGKT